MISMVSIGIAAGLLFPALIFAILMSKQKS